MIHQNSVRFPDSVVAYDFGFGGIANETENDVSTVSLFEIVAKLI